MTKAAFDKIRDGLAEALDHVVNCDAAASGWVVGERVVIDRRLIVKIERVTPSGRAVANGLQFYPDGWQVSSASRLSKLERLTPEIEAAMALAIRASCAGMDADVVLDTASAFVRKTFGAWRQSTPSAADVEKAERIITAVRLAMETAS